MRAPGLRCMRRLTARGAGADVVVDAADWGDECVQRVAAKFGLSGS
jgi:hypothetical protein